MKKTRLYYQLTYQLLLSLSDLYNIKKVRMKITAHFYLVWSVLLFSYHANTVWSCCTTFIDTNLSSKREPQCNRNIENKQIWIFSHRAVEINLKKSVFNLSPQLWLSQHKNVSFDSNVYVPTAPHFFSQLEKAFSVYASYGAKSGNRFSFEIAWFGFVVCMHARYLNIHFRQTDWQSKQAPVSKGGCAMWKPIGHRRPGGGGKRGDFRLQGNGTHVRTLIAGYC